MSTAHEDDASVPFRVALADAAAELSDPGTLSAGGRASRAIVREGPMRVNLMAIGAGGGIPTHTAPGPITVHVLAGSISFRVGDSWSHLNAGDLLALPAGVEHEVKSKNSGVFLLTIVSTMG